MVNRLIEHICRLFEWLMVICLAAMVLMVFGNVVLRYGFNSGITVSEELSRWLFVWMTFLGAFVALHTRQHLGTDMLVARLSRTGRKLCFVLARLGMLFVCVLVVLGGWQQTLINRDALSAVMQVSGAIFYASGVVFGVLGGLVVLHELVQVLGGGGSDDMLLGFAASEEQPHGEARP
jgi:TRAP-type C4-dicarboxylate transport system permease small subunit